MSKNFLENQAVLRNFFDGKKESRLDLQPPRHLAFFSLLLFSEKVIVMSEKKVYFLFVLFFSYCVCLIDHQQDLFKWLEEFPFDLVHTISIVYLCVNFHLCNNLPSLYYLYVYIHIDHIYFIYIYIYIIYILIY